MQLGRLWFILWSGVCCILVGCTEHTRISPETLEVVSKPCESNGGVKEYSMWDAHTERGVDHIIVTCKNLGKFDMYLSPTDGAKNNWVEIP